MDSIIHLNTTTSTSDDMARLLAEHREQVQEGTLIYADFQTAGRGADTNTWESVAGTNLLCHMVLFPDFISPSCQFIVSKTHALGIYDFLTLDVGLDPLLVTIKWPNDIYYKDFKISGTIIEGQLSGAGIEFMTFGTGINLNQKKFYSSAPNPISYFQITGKEYPVTLAAEMFRRRVMARYMVLASGNEDKITADYDAHIYRHTGVHTFLDPLSGPFQASIVEVKIDGSLVLQRTDGSTHAYLFKEVQFVI